MNISYYYHNIMIILSSYYHIIKSKYNNIINIYYDIIRCDESKIVYKQ